MAEHDRKDILAALTSACNDKLPVDIVMAEDGYRFERVKVGSVTRQQNGLGLVSISRGPGRGLTVRLEAIREVHTYKIVPASEEREWRVILKHPTRGDLIDEMTDEEEAIEHARLERLDYSHCEVYIESRRVGPWEKTDG